MKMRRGRCDRKFEIPAVAKLEGVEYSSAQHNSQRLQILFCINGQKAGAFAPAGGRGRGLTPARAGQPAGDSEAAAGIEPQWRGRSCPEAGLQMAGPPSSHDSMGARLVSLSSRRVAGRSRGRMAAGGDGMIVGEAGGVRDGREAREGGVMGRRFERPEPNEMDI